MEPESVKPSQSPEPSPSAPKGPSPVPLPPLPGKLVEFVMLTIGTSLVAVGVYFFKFPNNFSMGGCSGLAVLLSQLIPAHIITPTVLNNILNLAFLLLGFLTLGKSFGLKTVYCSLLYTLLTQVFEWVFPLSGPLTNQKMLELFFAVILPALGAAILFNVGATSGGTDILAMVIKKFTGLNTGNAMLLSDVLIAASALFIFDPETGLFSLLGLCLKSVLVDSAIESINRRKSFTVVTHDPEPVCRYINGTLGRGATVWKGMGAYTHQEQYIVLTALSRHQAVMLRNHLRQNDPHAFILVTNSSEIFGKGFLTP